MKTIGFRGTQHFQTHPADFFGHLRICWHGTSLPAASLGSRANLRVLSLSMLVLSSGIPIEVGFVKCFAELFYNHLPSSFIHVFSSKFPRCFQLFPCERRPQVLHKVGHVMTSVGGWEIVIADSKKIEPVQTLFCNYETSAYRCIPMYTSFWDI